MMSARIRQHFPRVVDGKVVQSNGVSGFLQTSAGCHHQIVGGDGFQNLNHSLLRGQQTYVILKQDFAGTVHKGAVTIAKHVEA